MLRMISYLIEPSKGEILIDGERLSRKYFYQHSFGCVFQDPALLPWRTVLGNVQLSGQILKDKNIVNKSGDFIKLVGLEGYESMFPRQLSGGMKTRVAIARALVFYPSILIMDEPFGDLDEITRDRMSFELLRIKEKINNTVIFVTHKIDEAVLLSDRIIVLSPSPGKVKKIVDVALPKPRCESIRRQLEFVNLVEDLREVLFC
jgi:NitT/TauT family transport system ATP-binding protein